MSVYVKLMAHNRMESRRSPLIFEWVAIICGESERQKNEHWVEIAGIYHWLHAAVQLYCRDWGFTGRILSFAFLTILHNTNLGHMFSWCAKLSFYCLENCCTNSFCRAVQCLVSRLTYHLCTYSLPAAWDFLKLLDTPFGCHYMWWEWGVRDRKPSIEWKFLVFIIGCMQWCSI